MRKRNINKQTRINGFYMKDFIRGFFGESDQGRTMLNSMYLNPYEIPFSMVTFLKKGHACWRDAWGNVARIRFAVKPTQLECYGEYRKRKKNIRMVTEWTAEDNVDKVARLTSEAIGELCVKCIVDNME